MGTRFESKFEPTAEPQPLDMLGHCIFCLRKTSSERNLCNRLRKISGDFKQDSLQVVPTPEFGDGTYLSNSSLLNCLNRIWTCVQKNSDGNGEGDGEDNFEGHFRVMIESKKVFFTELPPMCHFCAGKLISVDQMMRELVGMLDKLGGIISDSKAGKFSWRGATFVKTLSSSSLESSTIRQTFELLGLSEAESFSNATGEDDQEAAQEPFHKISPPVSMELDLDPGPSGSFAGDTILVCDDGDQDGGISGLQFINENESEDEDDIKSELEDDTDDEAVGFGGDGSIGDDDDINKQGNLGNGSDQDSDPDYIKSEEEEGSSEEEMESMSFLPEDGEEEVKAGHSVTHSKIDTDNSGPSSNIKVTDNKDKQKPRNTKKSAHSDPEPEKSATFSKSVDPITGQDIFTCTIDGCGVVIPISLRSLQCHQRTAHQVKTNVTHACDICGRTYAFRPSLIHHRKQVHPTHFTGRTQKCDLCRQLIPLPQIFEHVRDHVGEEHIRKCPNSQCPNVYIFSRYLNQHITQSKSCREAIPNVDQFLHPVHTCEVCGFSTSDVQVLRGHVNRNHETTEKVFSCPIQDCQQRFTVKQSVSLHLPYHYNPVSSSWNQDKQFSCDKCDKVYTSRAARNSHRWLKHRDNSASGSVKKAGGIFKCEECEGQEFKSNAALRSHNIQVHGKDWHTCKICSEKFASTTLLAKHNREVHKGIVLEFKCDFPGCDKVYKDKANLITHVSFDHMGDKSNVCDQCGKVYRNAKGLANHMKVTHLKIRSHVCEVCGESFTEGSVLKNHRLIHTGERPFACEICGQRFRQKVVLTRHLQGHEKKGEEFKPNGPMKGIRKRKGEK